MIKLKTNVGITDFPSIGVSYTDASGKEQFCGIGESLEDGSIYLFEIGAVNKKE